MTLVICVHALRKVEVTSCFWRQPEKALGHWSFHELRGFASFHDSVKNYGQCLQLVRPFATYCNSFGRPSCANPRKFKSEPANACTWETRTTSVLWERNNFGPTPVPHHSSASLLFHGTEPTKAEPEIWRALGNGSLSSKPAFSSSRNFRKASSKRDPSLITC